MHSRDPRFPATRPSLVRDIGSADDHARAVAYDALVRAYWPPVQAYIRRQWHLDDEGACDLAQEFFARDLEKAYLAKFDPRKARFRTFLRTCLDAFLANQHQAARRLKRGGGTRVESLEPAALGELPAADERNPDQVFHDEWVRSVFARALDELRARCEAAHRSTAFALFLRYDVEDHDAGSRPSYAALAREFGVASTDVTNQLAWARRAFREAALRVLRDICASEDEYRSEARSLLGVTPP